MSVVERALNKLRRESDGVTVTTPQTGRQEASRAIGALADGSAGEYARGDRADSPLRRILIDRDAVREAGYLPESGCDRQFADHYRQIKRPLIASAFAATKGKENARLIMMASALPGDGKTFTSINLALSIARERDTSVVLVDADVLKPHVSRIFGVDKEMGLVDALADNSVDVESLIFPTDTRGLSILSSGRGRDNAAELIASERMRQVVRRIIEDDPRRIVLFDSAPLLVSSESRALADIVGQVVLVVRARHTPRQAVVDALAHISNEESVRLVLNQGRPGITQSYYGQEAYGSYGNEPAA